MSLGWKFRRTARASDHKSRAGRGRTRSVDRSRHGLGSGSPGPGTVAASPCHAATTPDLLRHPGHPDQHLAAEAGSPGSMAMFELNWASFEPTQGVFSASYLATMKSELAAYQAAGMKVTLGLGLQTPRRGCLKLADSRYVDQNGTTSAEANFVFSPAVRTAAASYLALINAASRCRASTPSG